MVFANSVTSGFAPSLLFHTPMAGVPLTRMRVPFVSAEGHFILVRTVMKRDSLLGIGRHATRMTTHSPLSSASATKLPTIVMLQNTMFSFAKI
jgi:hypothetical protein